MFKIQKCIIHAIYNNSDKIRKIINGEILYPISSPIAFTAVVNVSSLHDKTHEKKIKLTILFYGFYRDTMKFIVETFNIIFVIIITF